MADAFRVVVPAPGRRTMGMLRPAEGACGGVLIVEDAGARTPLSHAICAEVELYLQAAGFNTLSLSLPGDVDMGTRASRILGGVGMLRSLHRDKIVVITATPPHAISRAEASAKSLAALLDLAARDAQSLPDAIRVVRDLTVTIRNVAESVVGVAALIAPLSPQPSHTETTPPRRTLPRTLPATTGPNSTGTVSRPPSAPASLLLPLPAVGDTLPPPRVAAETVSRLYLWTLSQLRAQESQAMPDQPAPSPSRILHSTMIEQREQLAAARENWHARLRWVDEQWVKLLGDLRRSDPARSARVRLASIPAGHSNGYSVRGARLAWRYLTGNERQTWLQVCHVVFQRGPLPGGVADTWTS